MNRQRRKFSTFKLVIAALMLAAGIYLPFLTGQIPQIGKMLLPMHIPVLLCGMICGWQYGLVVGLILPALLGVLYGMPVFFPMGMAMCFELATYGLVIGLLYKLLPKNIGFTYVSLIVAMIAGRIVWGVVRVIQSGVSGSAFTWKLFMSGAFLNAIPGIIIQLVFIPAIMLVLVKAGVLPDEKESSIPVSGSADAVNN